VGILDVSEVFGTVSAPPPELETVATVIEPSLTCFLQREPTRLSLHEACEASVARFLLLQIQAMPGAKTLFHIDTGV